MLIDCDTCVVRGAACSDCVIGVLLRRPPIGTPVDLDADETAAFGSLACAGMVPPLQLVPKVANDAFGAGHDAQRGDTPGRARHPSNFVPRTDPARGRERPGSGRSEGIA